MKQKARNTENINQVLSSMGYTTVPLRQNIAGQLLVNVTISEIEGINILDSVIGQIIVDSKRKIQ